jgi:hypothetical protein
VIDELELGQRALWCIGVQWTHLDRLGWIDV